MGWRGAAAPCSRSRGLPGAGASQPQPVVSRMWRTMENPRGGQCGRYRARGWSGGPWEGWGTILGATRTHSLLVAIPCVGERSRPHSCHGSPSCHQCVWSGPSGGISERRARRLWSLLRSNSRSRHRGSPRAQAYHSGAVSAHVRPFQDGCLESFLPSERPVGTCSLS